MKKMIKFRAFHYYLEVPAPGMVGGPMMLAEQQAYFGDTVDIEREEDLARGEKLGAFYSDKEIKQIKEGKYRGPDWEQLAAGPMVAAFTPEEEARRAILAPAGTGGESESEGGPAIDVGSASDEEIAEETDRLVHRDSRDSQQTGQAPDAVLLDTTYLTQEDQVDRIVALANAVTQRGDGTSKS